MLAEILSWRETRRSGYITLVNPHSIVMCVRDTEMHSAILGSNLILPDGVGIMVASCLLGYGHNHRVPGPSLLLSLCDLGRPHGLRHFFYGGAGGVAAILAQRLADRCPGLLISGILSPPFQTITPEEDDKLLERINASSPDIVWVALGTGKQEKWMATNIARLRASAVIGVGAAFNFHAGTVPWAPAWIRRAGLEWAYRFAHEPRRLWRRNLDSFVFLARIAAQRMGCTVAPPRVEGADCQVRRKTQHIVHDEACQCGLPKSRT